MKEEKIEAMDLEKARWITDGLTDEEQQAFLKVLAEDPDHFMETIQLLSYTIAKMAIPMNSETTKLETCLTVDETRWKVTTTVKVAKAKEEDKLKKLKKMKEEQA